MERHHASCVRALYVFFLVLLVICVCVLIYFRFTIHLWPSSEIILLLLLFDLRSKCTLYSVFVVYTDTHTYNTYVSRARLHIYRWFVWCACIYVFYYCLYAPADMCACIYACYSCSCFSSIKCLYTDDIILDALLVNIEIGWVKSNELESNICCVRACYMLTHYLSFCPLPLFDVDV